MSLTLGSVLYTSTACPQVRQMMLGQSVLVHMQSTGRLFSTGTEPSGAQRIAPLFLQTRGYKAWRRYPQPTPGQLAILALALRAPMLRLSSIGMARRGVL